jgi:hypothetical protein
MGIPRRFLNKRELRSQRVRIKSDTALPGVMRYTIGGQDAHPTRVLLFNRVPQKSEICCKLKQFFRFEL